MSGGTPHWAAGLGEAKNKRAKGLDPVAVFLGRGRVPATLREAVATMRSLFEEGVVEGWVALVEDHHKMPTGGSLTAEQSKAVFLYTMECDFYKMLNTVMRESYKDRSRLLLVLPFLRLLGSALKVAPRFEGSVYRGIKDEGSTVFDYYNKKSKVEGTAVWYQVNSCTRRVKAVDQFLKGEYMVFTIEGAVGADVAAYSAVPTEAEVVLFSCSRYRVLSCGAVSRMVQLEAVHKAHDEFYDLYDVVGKAAAGGTGDGGLEVAALVKQLEETNKEVKRKDNEIAALVKLLRAKEKKAEPKEEGDDTLLGVLEGSKDIIEEALSRGVQEGEDEYGLRNILNDALQGKKFFTDVYIGNHALHLAAHVGAVAIVKGLLAVGAPIDIVTGTRWTPLHYASHYGHADVVEALLGAGADKGIKDSYGMTARDKARERGHPAVVSLLS